MNLSLYLLIRRVLLRAFELLHEERAELATPTEDQITAALRSIIENNLRQNGSVLSFNRRTYDHVVRQGQWANHCGSVLTKTPDLCFRLRHDETPTRPVIPEFDALFIECKLVDAKHPVAGRYCDDRLIRFVRGDYAWAMQEGMMLGYVRDGKTIARHLIPAMSEPRRMRSLRTISLPAPSRCPPATACHAADAIHGYSESRFDGAVLLKPGFLRENPNWGAGTYHIRLLHGQASNPSSTSRSPA